jgi:hypothetical protein
VQSGDGGDLVEPAVAESLSFQSGNPATLRFVESAEDEVELAVVIRDWAGAALAIRTGALMQGTFHAGSSQGFRIVYGAQAEREVADGRILGSSVDLASMGVQWLAPISKRRPEDIRSRLSGMSHFDLDRWLAALGLDPGADPGIALVRRVLAGVIEGDPVSPHALCPLVPDASTILNGLARFVPTDDWPTLLIQAPSIPPDEWLFAAARDGLRVTTSIPAWPVAVCCDAALAERTLRVPNPRRELAWLREGWVDVPSLDRRAIGDRVTVRLGEATLDRLERDGVSIGLAEKLDRVAQSLAETRTPESESRARSAAEEFLFERLESIPETAGSFHLNRPLDFNDAGTHPVKKMVMAS